jgi:hypothetical protein
VRGPRGVRGSLRAGAGRAAYSDLDGSLNDSKGTGSDLEDSGKNAVKTVTDFF